MAYQIHEVADGDIIQASTTIEQDTQIKLNEENIEALSNGKIAEPQSEGTNGQVLTTDGNGGRSWTSPQVPTDAQVQSAVNDWLDDHPEASTTVEDGSISYAKLDTTLKGKADEVTSLSSAINDIKGDGEATDSDVGKALYVKSVENGRVTAWEFLAAGITCTDDGEGNITIHIGNGGGGDMGFNILPYVGGLTNLFQDCVCPENVTLDFEGNTTLTSLSSLAYRCSGLKNLTIKNLTSTKTTVGLNSLGYLASDLETITFDNCSIAPFSFESLGRNAPKLKAVYGELDLTNCSSVNSIANWFAGNISQPSIIEEFRIKPNSIKRSPGTIFGNSAVISNDSLISLANGLSPDVNDGVIKLIDAHKTKIASITGTNDNGLFVASQSGALSLADFITTVKGWTIE